MCLIKADLLLPGVAKLLKVLYDEDILSEEVLVKWYSELPKDSGLSRKVSFNFTVIITFLCLYICSVL